MMKDKTGFFLFSCTLHDELPQRPQQIFAEWTNVRGASFEFFYVDPPSCTRFVRNIPRTFLRHQKSSGPPIIYDHEHLMTGWLFPFTFGLPDQLQSIIIQKFFMRRALRKYRYDVQKRIAIVATPFWEPVICKDEFDLICYDYLDSIEMFRKFRHYARIRMNHERMLEKSDIIFVTANTLKDEVLAAGVPEQNVIHVSNGVNIDFFNKALESFVPADYVKNDKKTVGYVGGVPDWVDLELVYGAACRLPNVDFVLVGADKPTATKIKAQPNNVYFLGLKEYYKIPSYIALFDVAMIPFKISAITNAVDPVKLYEYFALGKPVVATSINELQKLNDGLLLRVANTEEEFAAAISFFLAEDNIEWQRSRVRIAQKNSWSSKAEQIIATAARKLATREYN